MTARLAVILVVSIAVASCSRREPPQVPAAANATAPILSATNQPTSASIVLSCDDATAPGAPPGDDDSTAMGLTFSGTSQLAASEWGSERPISAPDGGQYFEVKVFLYVDASASNLTTVSLVNPPDGFMRYVDNDSWAKPTSDADFFAAGAKSFTFESCPARGTVGYFGGVTVAGPTCIRLAVEPQDGRPAREISFPTAGAAC